MVNLLKRAEVLETAEATLKQAGYAISRRCRSRPSCFDFAARRDEKLVFIKVFPDIHDVSPGDALGIRRISSHFSCTSILLSDRNDEEMLRDDTLYSRYGVSVITPKTFDDIVQGAFPLVEAAPGGYVVRLDGGKIRARRYNLGLSIGKLARMIGVSRRTLYGYERDMTRASVSAAYGLEKTLGIPLVKTMDLFKVSASCLNGDDSLPCSRDNITNGLLRSVIGKISQFDLKVSLVKRAPFDFIVYCPQAGFKIIGAVFRTKEGSTEQRVKEIVSLSKVVGAKPLLMSKEKIPAPDDIAFLKCGEIDEIENREELTALI
jgi:putative transcriptional regulator